MKNKLTTKGLVLALAMLIGLGGASYVFGSATSNFTQTINAGTLTTDIVDGSYVTVASPAVAMGAKTFSYTCQTAGDRASGTFGTATENIYVQNPDASDTGWTLSLAATASTDVWDSAGTDFDFNDPTTGGCTDSADTDTVGGQMTVDPSAGTLTIGACASCSTTGVTKGSSTAFVETTGDDITILDGAVGSDDIGDWKLTGVSVLQTIPAEQPAASDYDISLTLTIAAI